MAKFSVHRALNSVRIGGKQVILPSEAKDLTIKDKFDRLMKSIDECCHSESTVSVISITEHNELLDKETKEKVIALKELKACKDEHKQLSNKINERFSELVNAKNKISKLHTYIQIYRIVIGLIVALGIVSYIIFVA